MATVSGAETERSGPKLGWSGAERERERVSEKLGRAERSVSGGPPSGNGAVSGGQKNQV